ncbi:MAG: hypothetical protein MZU95_08005 [Desulfomicrobium escambiense]|nr:hypothetical protein [Desulfomicrobium escambiense]
MFGVACKFSPRNPGYENRIREELGDKADFVTLGHLVSGQLHFVPHSHRVLQLGRLENLSAFCQGPDHQPQRVALDEAEINILKADGGTMPLARALEAPVQSILLGTCGFGHGNSWPPALPTRMS